MFAPASEIKPGNDLGPDRKGGSGGRRRRINHVEGPGLLDEREILDQLPGRAHGLGAHSRPSGSEVFDPQIRHQPLKRSAEEPLAPRAADFIPTHAAMPGKETPEARIAEGIGEVAEIDVLFAVPFPRTCKHCVRSGLHAAVDEAGEVNAEEGKVEVGDGVDEMANEALALRTELIIFAPEGNDLCLWSFAGKLGHPV